MILKLIIIGAILLIIVLPLFIFLLTGILGAPYVPSEKPDIRKAFTDLYPLDENEYIVDLGCGDGVVVETATEFGAKAVGVDINPLMIWFCKWRFRKNKNSRYVSADMYRYKLPAKTTAIYMYMLPLGLEATFKHLRKEATRLNKTLYLISNAFDLKNEKPYKREAPYFLYKIKPETDPAPKPTTSSRES
jgi:ubiquinone/menaquinone biosynthesis C-methylase UbiE